MADTTLSSLSSDQAEAARATFLLALADRNWLGALPQLIDIGSCNNMNSNVLSIAVLDLMGASGATATNEATAYTPVALGDAKIQVTVTKGTHAHTPSDIVRIIKGHQINPQNLAMNALAIGAAFLSDKIATAGSTFTATGGPGTGVDLDIPSILAAVGLLGTLNVDLSAGVAGVVHGQQWSDALVDSAATGGMQANQNPALFDLKPGSQGRMWGVDWTVSNRVPTINAGADRGGCIFAKGGIVWGRGEIPVDGADQVQMGFTFFERARQALAGKTDWVTHVYTGVSKGLEAGVTLFSDA